MKKVLTIGGVVRDVFIECKEIARLTIDGRPCIVLPEGTKQEVQSIEQYVGGGAANSAISFNRLGFTVEAFFKIGSDPDGDFVLNTLNGNGIATEHSIRTTQSHTGNSFIIPTPSGDRAVLVYRGANTLLCENEIPTQAIAECDQLYVTSLSDQSALLVAHITALAKKHNKRVAINPGGSQIRAHTRALCDALPNVDTFILNSSEAAQLMLCMAKNNTQKPNSPAINKNLPLLLQKPMEHQQTQFWLHDYFKNILSMGPAIAVVTNGAEGVYVACDNTIYFHPSLPIKPTSTIGAGDAFGSTFTAMLLHGASIEEALVSGIINSSSVIQHIGAQTGLLDAQKLKDQRLKVGLDNVQRFDL